MDCFPFHGAQKPTGGSDDDDDETLPSKEGLHQVNHKRPERNFYRVTVHPSPGGSFDRAGTPQELGATSIDPTLVFGFNYKLDMNGIICDKQIHTTTTAFDLGEAAPTELMSDSFGWYQNPLEVSLRNCADVKLHSYQLNETLKETKISVKTTHAHSKNSTLQRGAQVEGGYKTFIQVRGSANIITSNGEIIAKETVSENSISEVLKGFQHQDLRVGLNSLVKYRFSGRDPPIPVLEDPKERHKYLGTGMCEAVVPTCIGIWLITAEDVNEHSPYLFDVERTLNCIFKVDKGSKRRQHFFKRTLNRIFKVGQGSEQREKFVQRCHEEFVQHYRVPIYVNHAMSHLRDPP
ncbi:hypothetical protein CY35_17G110000 [Sphagnum magellanicum]|nr:hypothetical protein CY35_17G110000 [Sphagnum magellanicum]